MLYEMLTGTGPFTCDDVSTDDGGGECVWQVIVRSTFQHDRQHWDPPGSCFHRSLVVHISTFDQLANYLLNLTRCGLDTQSSSRHDQRYRDRRQEQLACDQSQALGRLARGEPVVPLYGHHSSFASQRNAPVRCPGRRSTLRGSAGTRKHASVETCSKPGAASATTARRKARARVLSLSTERRRATALWLIRQICDPGHRIRPVSCGE